MQVEINNVLYEVVITRKRTNRNTYIRLKEDLKIYVNTNSFVSDSEIRKMIFENEDYIIKLTKKINNKLEKEAKFYYLGKEYDLVYTNDKEIFLGQEKLFLNRKSNLEKWYKEEAMRVFSERLRICYDNFSRDIPYPSLTIRKMTTRWGVCNYRIKRVTLNLELIKKDIESIDYVIIHELSHLVEGNHSKDFWKVVSENIPNYKEIRKRLKEV